MMTSSFLDHCGRSMAIGRATPVPGNPMLLTVSKRQTASMLTLMDTVQRQRSVGSWRLTKDECCRTFVAACRISANHTAHVARRGRQGSSFSKVAAAASGRNARLLAGDNSPSCLPAKTVAKTDEKKGGLLLCFQGMNEAAVIFPACSPKCAACRERKKRVIAVGISVMCGMSIADIRRFRSVNHRTGSGHNYANAASMFASTCLVLRQRTYDT